MRKKVHIYSVYRLSSPSVIPELRGMRQSDPQGTLASQANHIRMLWVQVRNLASVNIMENKK